MLSKTGGGVSMLLTPGVHTSACRPDHLPPSQGGKYVGFGSSPAPQPSARGGGSAALGAVNVDDVTHMLSKGLTSLTHVS
jgi:ADP-ribosylation factor GTPase-activating protein 1